MNADEFGCSGAAEMSVFHGLFDGNTEQPPIVGPPPPGGTVVVVVVVLLVVVLLVVVVELVVVVVRGGFLALVVLAPAVVQLTARSETKPTTRSLRTRGVSALRPKKFSVRS